MSGVSDKRLQIVVVLKGYPRISETFIAQELRALEEAGFRLSFASLRHPTSKKRHPIHDEIEAPVSYLPEYLHQEPARVFRAWRKARRLQGYSKAWRHWIGDLRRDFTTNRIRRFGQALVLAAEFPGDAAWIYCHFIHTPSSVGRYAADMLDARWSASAHAKDIWTSPDWELTEKLGSAAWAVTCTASGAEHLRRLAPDPAKVHLVYHGIDLERFPSPPERHSRADGSDPEAPVQLLSVGRAVAKKGFDTLLDALALLPADLHWTWRHAGGGDLEGELKQKADALGLSDRVTFAGSMTQEQILACYRAADLFVLPCRIDETGDRDGLPNVLVEAQSQALMCISTPISGIPELVEDGKNGLLVPPNDPRGLSEALARVIADPAMRRQFGAAGETRVRADFSHRSTIGALVGLFEASGLKRAG